MAQKLFFISIKALIKKNNKILILKSVDGRDLSYWDVPGGTMDEGEEIRQTLERELKEELESVTDVQILDLIHASKLSRNLLSGPGLMTQFYSVKADLPGSIKLSHEHQEYRWVGLDEIDQLGVNDGSYIEEGYKTAIKKALLV